MPTMTIIKETLKAKERMEKERMENRKITFEDVKNCGFEDDPTFDYEFYSNNSKRFKNYHMIEAQKNTILSYFYISRCLKRLYYIKTSEEDIDKLFDITGILFNKIANYAILDDITIVLNDEKLEFKNSNATILIADLDNWKKSNCGMSYEEYKKACNNKEIKEYFNKLNVEKTNLNNLKNSLKNNSLTLKELINTYNNILECMNNVYDLLNNLLDNYNSYLEDKDNFIKLAYLYSRRSNKIYKKLDYDILNKNNYIKEFSNLFSIDGMREQIKFRIDIIEKMFAAFDNIDKELKYDGL